MDPLKPETSAQVAQSDTMTQKKDPQTKEATKAALLKPEKKEEDNQKIQTTYKKTLDVNAHEIKESHEQIAQKEAEANALNQIISTIKNNKEAAAYEQTIKQSLSERVVEQQNNIKKAATESVEQAKVLKKVQQEEKEKLTKMSSSLKELIQKDPELQGLLPQVVIEVRPEGLRIQLIDQDARSMFASGSSSMTPQTRKLLKTVAHLIEKIPNSLVISGHTDAHPYVGAHKYGNWELSADRANATRRALEEFNINSRRFESVMGKEAADPFVKEDPFAASNRRISITVLNQFGVAAPEVK